mmetsp:Transcript_2052/g.2705  ORF Transcript_2052/g.2705 Transcript_2052/m.2705 type:complete len:280 (-) Transcript_2052:219-1058(-)|eukprot:CAMPEP_0197297264 /NCGR_PEP_ID=MMETSP0890-20130614/40589_1 /TAXON_ID=44058 ORGANISM="Aureoumbra lagunensis, Strain CCMP1510" /NCGR_SAMPLE_ID=MMETSP0890 /ASSEMBLY_ACC=CAM_ASM_000533 /LENGTH=279 /DNA_ID=CAMNT_0042774317 /DNA_START=71 /DNA_END=910 /DNA_ORIENTATION=-
MSGKQQTIKFFSSWFCPFAHRAWLAFEHHGNLQYEWIEALGWEERAATGREQFDASTRSSWYYHWKSPDLLAANPQGMIPTLVAQGNRVATESIPCIALIDTLARQQGSTKHLVPEDPWEAAKCYVWADKVNKQICSEYYSCLVPDSQEERVNAFTRLCSGINDFCNHLSFSEYGGPFFDGRHEPSIVDFTLLPYATRFYVLDHYRGFVVSGQNPKYDAWLQACLDLGQHIQATIPDKERYQIHINKYASGRARSKVANAVRRGVNALDYDHKIDDSEH